MDMLLDVFFVIYAFGIIIRKACTFRLQFSAKAYFVFQLSHCQKHAFWLENMHRSIELHA